MLNDNLTIDRSSASSIQSGNSKVYAGIEMHNTGKVRRVSGATDLVPNDLTISHEAKGTGSSKTRRHLVKLGRVKEVAGADNVVRRYPYGIHAVITHGDNGNVTPSELRDIAEDLMVLLNSTDFLERLLAGEF